MNEYKNKFGYTSNFKIEVPQKELTVNGYKISDIKKEDIVAFCESRQITPEYFVNELIKNLD